MNGQQLINSIYKLAFEGKLFEENINSLSLKQEIDNAYNNEFPYIIPNNWEWVKIGDICQIKNGFTPKKSNPKFWDNGTIPWFTIADIRNQGRTIKYTEQFITKEALGESNKRIIPKNSVLICCTASVGEVAITEIDLTTNQQFNGLVIKEEFKYKISTKYLYHYSKTLKNILLKNAGKTTINFVSVRKLSNIYIPLPPIEEQNKIVKKIEEILPKIKEYDQLYSEITEINDTFPENIKKSILQYAVKGKLTNQKIEDSAHVLYKKINDDINLKCLEGKYKKPKILNDINDNEIEFDIPMNWKWVRLGNLLYKLTDGTHTTPTYTENGVPFISVKDISSGKINFSHTRFISEHEHQTLFKRCNPEKNDILLTKVGTTGIPVIVDTEKQFSLFVSVALLKFNNSLISNEYLAYAINSPLVQSQVKENTRGVGNKNWVMRDIANTILPLPPYEEQQRIVNTLNQLFKIIDTK